jgi:hypothetical protein
VPEAGRRQGDDEAQRLYQDLLKRLGLEHVTCQACARALMPAPFNLESYTYTARSGPSWTWDVGFARALVARRPPPAQTQRLDPEQVELWLEHHCQIDRQHLGHIPTDRLEEPVLLAPAPDGQGQILIDGSHRAAFRVQSGLTVYAHLLSDRESASAIAITPLTMQAVHQVLRARKLLPDEF